MVFWKTTFNNQNKTAFVSLKYKKYVLKLIKLKGWLRSREEEDTAAAVAAAVAAADTTAAAAKTAVTAGGASGPACQDAQCQVTNHSFLQLIYIYK